MSDTPTATPVKPEKSRRLPMIVDIAIDSYGKQMYQVHESSKQVRKKMPQSTKFVSEEEKTPVRQVLGTISPSTLNQKKVKDSDSDATPESAADELGLNIFTGDNKDTHLSSAEQGTSSSGGPRTQESDIWSEDVESALEEVLHIIPKNGLNKIKISGKSCGRNELISDYIYMKTGKYRSRKQVSSHIQVIKNMGQKEYLIRLINEGPVFENDEEVEKNNKRFEEIFSKINLQKSLGMGSSVKRKHKRESSSSSQKKQKPGPISFSNFSMSVVDNEFCNPFLLTSQGIASEGVKLLKLKENANITSRFPGLDGFQNTSIPILHNMVKLQIPRLPENYSLSNGFGSSYRIDYVLPKDYKKTFSMFTCVYSFGNEVLKLTENDVQPNTDVPFLNKFWKMFLSKLEGKSDTEISMALKGITIKQIFYVNSSSSLNANFIRKQKIKLVLLWEFGGVKRPHDALTTTTQLELPNNYVSASNNIVPQVVNYPSVPTSAATTALSQAMPPSAPPLGQQPYSAVHSIPSSSATVPPPSVTSATSAFETNWEVRKPQVSIQERFHLLQEQQQHQPSQPPPPFVAPGAYEQPIQATNIPFTDPPVQSTNAYEYSYPYMEYHEGFMDTLN